MVSLFQLQAVHVYDTLSSSFSTLNFALDRKPHSEVRTVCIYHQVVDILCTYITLCSSVHTYISTWIHSCEYILADMRTYVHMHTVHTCTWIHTYMHMCTYTYIHAYTGFSPKGGVPGCSPPFILCSVTTIFC